MLMDCKKYSLGVDIGGTKTLIVMLDENKNIICKKQYPTNRDICALAEKITSFISESGISAGDIHSIGFGICGITNFNSAVVVAAPAIDWFDVDLKSEIGKRFNFSFSVYADNDVNCCAMGEKNVGLLCGIDEAFYIAIGTGIGGAPIIGGNIRRGFSHSAGEVGLFKCSHKNMFLEDRISGSAINRRAAAFNMTSYEVFDRYNDDGSDKSGLIAEFTDEIAVLCANIINILNPQRIIIGGGVSRSMRKIIYDIRKKTDELTPIKAEIELSALDNDAAAIGAALLYRAGKRDN